MGLQQPLEGALVSKAVGVESCCLIYWVCEDGGEDGDGPRVDPHGKRARVEAVPVAGHE